MWIEGDNELTSVDDSRQLGPVSAVGRKEAHNTTMTQAATLQAGSLISLLATYAACIQIPMGLLGGRVTHVLWPPSRIGAVRTTLDPAGGPQRVRTREQVHNSYM